jgi:LCP family protein required for cell wall assembly
MIYRKSGLPYNTRPKNKILKIIILSLLVAIIGIGVWIGWTAIRSLKKITAVDGGNFLSFLGDFNQPTLKGQSEGRTNILLMGMGGKSHPGGMLSDTNIVLSIDWATKKVAMLSIPRDLWVKVHGNGFAKLNAAHAYGEQNSKTSGGGGVVASETISKVLDIPVHYYLTIDFEGFKKIVDTVGGVDIYVDKAIYDPYYPANNMIDYDPFKISTGEHHLNGETALKYARSRETTSDFDRSRRQQQVMSAVKEKTLTLNILGNPKKITDLLNIIGGHLKTNMTVGEILSLWDLIKVVDTETMTNKVLDTAVNGPLTSVTDQRGYVVIPRKGEGNFIELQKLAKGIFSAASVADKQDLRI